MTIRLAPFKRLALCSLLALALAACAEASSGVDKPDVGQDGVDDTGGDTTTLSDTPVDTHQNDLTDTPDVVVGEVEVCVLNEGGPDGSCAADGVLLYGPIASAAVETRLFSLTNGTLNPIEILSATPDVTMPELAIQAVRYEVDPGDPANKLRIPQSLPASRDPGQVLYFEAVSRPVRTSVC